MNTRGIEVGTPIMWIQSDNTLTFGTATRMGLQAGIGVLWTDGRHKPEDCIYDAFCFPAKYQAELQQILDERAKLKKAYDDSAKLLYEFSNKVVKDALRTD